MFIKEVSLYLKKSDLRKELKKNMMNKDIKIKLIAKIIIQINIGWKINIFRNKFSYKVN